MSIELQDLPRLLSYINADDRDIWYKVGMGLYTEFGHDAREAWLSWGAESKSYDKKAALAVWNGLKKGGVTIGTVIYLAQGMGWTAEHKEQTPAEKKRIREDQEARRAARDKEIEADEAKKLRMQKVVAKGCQKIWENYCVDNGTSDYLKRKKVAAFDVGFFHQTVLLWIDDDKEICGVVSGSKVFAFFQKQPKPRPDNISFLMFKQGAITIPLRDETGEIWSLQAINSTGVKLFPKHCRKSGCYNKIHAAIQDVICISEGYATGASIHMATEWPVIVAFDAGNMVVVAKIIRQLHPDIKILICGDLDENGKGQSKANEAAEAVGGCAVFPFFGNQSVVANDGLNKQARSL